MPSSNQANRDAEIENVDDGDAPILNCEFLAQSPGESDRAFSACIGLPPNYAPIVA